MRRRFKFITVLAAVLILSVCSACVVDTEGVAVTDAEPPGRVSSQAVTYEAIVPAEAPACPDGCVTWAEACDRLSDLFHQHLDIEYDGAAPIRTDEFLGLLAEHGRYVTAGDDGGFELFGPSVFMEQAEFDKISALGDMYLPDVIFEDVVLRIERANAFLDGHAKLGGANEYAELIWSYYRQFWSLYETNPGVAAYWLQDALSVGGSGTRLSNILHEMAHEQSARLSYGYSHRTASGHNWQVFWFDNIHSIHPYDITTGGFKEIDMADLPETKAVIDTENICKSVRDTAWYQMYVDRDDAISNLFSIYGMAEEFCAGMIDVRFGFISSDIGYQCKTFTDDDLQAYYFWTSLMCEYLSSLETKYPDSYRTVMAGGDFTDLVRSVYAYVSEDIQRHNVVVSNAWDTIALKSWFYSDRIQALSARYFS